MGIQTLAMVGASFAALGVLVVFFYWPAEFALTAAPVSLSSPASVGGPSNSVGAFRDVTAQSGIQWRHTAGAQLRDIRQVMGPGVGLGDFDGDGLIDVFLPGRAAPNAEGGDRLDNGLSGGGAVSGGAGNGLFRNAGGFRFVGVPAAGGARSGEDGMGCAIADFDNDGDLDIYVTARGANRLYVNDGTGRFRERAAEAGVDDGRWSTGAAWCDYDRDGRLDLYVANYVRFSTAAIEAQEGTHFDRDEPPAFSPYMFDAEADVLYRNNGDGTFSDVTSDAGLAGQPGKGLGVLFADLSRDGWPDLLVINDVSANQFFQNDGVGGFRDVGQVSGLADPRSGMGVAVADYDGDGWFDVFSTHWQDESNVLYRNLGAGGGDDVVLLDDVTVSARLGAASIGLTGWGALMADFDHNAAPDVLVVNGYTSPAPGDATQCVGQVPLFFLNDGGRFTNRSSTAGLDALAPFASRGAAAGDLDNDGDLDVVVATNNGPAMVFENRRSNGHYLRVRPVSPVGCSVRVRCGGASQHRMIVSGSSYLSSEPLEAHFGLGDVTAVDVVTIEWPDGRRAERTQVAADQTLIVEAP